MRDSCSTPPSWRYRNNADDAAWSHLRRNATKSRGRSGPAELRGPAATRRRSRLQGASDIAYNYAKFIDYRRHLGTPHVMPVTGVADTAYSGWPAEAHARH